MQPIACGLEGLTARPEQLQVEPLLPEVIELVEMELEHSLVLAQLTPESAEVIETTREQRREPASGLVACLVELDREIDVTDLERPARVRAKDPHFPDARQIATVASRHAGEQALDPPRRFGSLHTVKRKACLSAFRAGPARLCASRLTARSWI